MLSRHRLKALASESFGPLVARAGLAPEGYRPVADWIKSDPLRCHIVRHYACHGGPDLVLKRIVTPEDPPHFAALLGAHKNAAHALETAEGQGVPAILAEDPERQAFLMAFQPGRTLRDLCRDSRDHAAALRAAGAWLGAYHGATFVEERAFQPRFMAGHMRHLAGQITRGERHIRGKRRFLALADAVQDHVADARDRPTRTAAKHGDFNARNILISDAETAGIDFQPATIAPVGYDIARLLVNYAQIAADLEAIPKGAVLPPEMLAAFFEGYRFVAPTDPGVGFLLRIQILTDWNRMQHKRTVESLVRFARLRKIARRAFG